MKFTSIPAAYSSFNSPLIYEFMNEEGEQDTLFEIVDLATNEVIGRKQLYATAGGSIDIAPYLRRRARVLLPQSVEGCGVVDCATQIKVKVTAAGVSSSSRNFIAAKVSPDAHYALLTHQMAQRTMAHDEFDIVAYFAMPDAVVEVVVEASGKGTESLSIEPSSGGHRCIAISAREFDGATTSLKATIKVDGQVADTIEYEIKPNLQGARRIAWLNSDSSPELYTFPMRKSILVEAVRKHIETLWGREAASLERHNELKLLSAYEPQQQIEALQEIVHSERLWLVRGAEVESIELKTERILVAPNDGMSIVEIDICSAEEGVRL
ncbi:MAG: hypothetical protein IKY82_02635 [Alistipes sp.]|nr:hypothetical protein [Alistipes sp.]